ncbi:MAG: SPOR domain-containing protein [Candidatus Omnitrophica bacterium]|nr:SPOR domain-containing protein [Candidatus Omnitrophota bacterium]
MEPGTSEGQLELFDLANQTAPRPHRESLGRVLLQARYDQILLTGVGVLLGLTVIFACGVERGKQLVRAEQFTLARQQPVSATSRDVPNAPTTQEPPSSAKTEERKAPASPTMTPQVKSPTKVASGSTAPVTAHKSATERPAATSKSRYAIQVVTYTRPQLAQQAMARLRAKGERTFLIIREGRTTVYVGPFPSKSFASQKLPTLKTQYQDCFVRTL